MRRQELQHWASVVSFPRDPLLRMLLVEASSTSVILVSELPIWQGAEARLLAVD